MNLVLLLCHSPHLSCLLFFNNVKLCAKNIIGNILTITSAKILSRAIIFGATLWVCCTLEFLDRLEQGSKVCLYLVTLFLSFLHFSIVKYQSVRLDILGDYV